MSSGAEKPRTLTLRRKVVFSLVPLALLLLCGELVLRVRYQALLDFKNARSDYLDVLRSNVPAAHDPELGWIPRPGTTGTENFWHTQVNIDDNGLRRHTRHDAAAGAAPILVTGDSFAFGEGVDDDATWPARLEAATGRRVFNGGVFGYGVDQIVMRTERLVERLNPGTVIVSFYPGDIQRCEYSCRWANKPYFTIENDKLELHNVPVPPPVPLATWKNYLGYSYLLHVLMLRIDRAWWLETARIQAEHSDGDAVAKLLVRRLAKLRDEANRRVLLVGTARAKLTDDLDRSRTLLTTARDAGMESLLVIVPESMLDDVHGHFTPDGNEQIAAAVAARLNGDESPEVRLP
jgi:hypothetical protein